MSALELLTWVNRLLFVALFAAVAWRAYRQPSRANLNTALLFFGIAGAVVGGLAGELLGVQPPWLTSVLVMLLNLCPFAMLRLVDDFSGSPRWVQLAGGVTFVAVALLSLLFFEQAQQPVGLVTIVWFLLVGGYAAVTFAGASRRSRGLTRWRMAAVAAGAYFFIAAIVVVFAAAFLPDVASITGSLAQVLALAAVVSFFLGFAPPAWLRRAWREPDLRAFLERSVHLSGVVDDRTLIGELQRAAADTLGTPGAALGLADPLGEKITYLETDGNLATYPSDMFVGGRAFTEQRRLIVSDTTAADPEQSDAYIRSNARVAIAVPVSADDRRLGVLVAFGDRAPIFVEDDLWLVQLLADQAAVILEARRMAREASDLRGREESTTLKEEFLSAAAHDLRTPLTVLLGQAELIERRLQRDPEAPVDAAGITRIVRESRRLRDLVSQLLDAQRLEDVGPGEDQEPVDVREVALSCLDRFTTDERPIVADLGSEPLPVRIERMRLEQVLDNLLQNAAKYAGAGPPTELRTWREGPEARIAVIDHGIGIPAGERGMVFERFFRASNAQARSDTGLGLGLHICRRIVEGHGGRISIEETPGGGSTFHVVFPTEVRSADVDTARADDVRLAGAAEARSDG
jgi:signal transduction histidine kinase/membrane protein YdbS with pleckstrin-like domain